MRNGNMGVAEMPNGLAHGPKAWQKAATNAPAYGVIYDCLLLKDFIMNAYLRFLTVISSLVVGLAACSSTSSHSETVGDQCNRVLNSICTRASACGLQGSVSDCTN